MVRRCSAGSDYSERTRDLWRTPVIQFDDPFSPAGGSGREVPRPSASPKNWPRLDGFELLEEIGRGGMGVVYKARHLRLNRLVALKLIRDDVLADPTRRARFGIEMLAAARPHHPNIVQPLDHGEQDGPAYPALELLEGRTLADRLKGKPPDPVTAAGLVETLARAVQHAHERGIVHRDL